MVKIRDVQIMVLQDGRTYTLIKVVADDGVYGIAEAYGTPASGVKEQVLSLKTWLVGKDPLETITGVRELYQFFAEFRAKTWITSSARPTANSAGP